MFVAINNIKYNNMLKIKITAAVKARYWYAGLIGQTIEALSIDGRGMAIISSEERLRACKYMPVKVLSSVVQAGDFEALKHVVVTNLPPAFQPTTFRREDILNRAFWVEQCKAEQNNFSFSIENGGKISVPKCFCHSVGDKVRIRVKKFQVGPAILNMFSPLSGIGFEGTINPDGVTFKHPLGNTEVTIKYNECVITGGAVFTGPNKVITEETGQKMADAIKEANKDLGVKDLNECQAVNKTIATDFERILNETDQKDESLFSLMFYGGKVDTKNKKEIVAAVEKLENLLWDAGFKKYSNTYSQDTKVFAGPGAAFTDGTRNEAEKLIGVAQGGPFHGQPVYKGEKGPYVKDRETPGFSDYAASFCSSFLCTPFLRAGMDFARTGSKDEAAITVFRGGRAWGKQFSIDNGPIGDYIKSTYGMTASEFFVEQAKNHAELCRREFKNAYAKGRTGSIIFGEIPLIKPYKPGNFFAGTMCSQQEESRRLKVLMLDYTYTGKFINGRKYKTGDLVKYMYGNVIQYWVFDAKNSNLGKWYLVQNPDFSPKPPLGLTPLGLAKDQFIKCVDDDVKFYRLLRKRIRSVRKAIARYNYAQMEIPVFWRAELAALGCYSKSTYIKFIKDAAK